MEALLTSPHPERAHPRLPRPGNDNSILLAVQPKPLRHLGSSLSPALYTQPSANTSSLTFKILAESNHFSTFPFATTPAQTTKMSCLVPLTPLQFIGYMLVRMILLKLKWDDFILLIKTLHCLPWHFEKELHMIWPFYCPLNLLPAPTPTPTPAYSPQATQMPSLQTSQAFPALRDFALTIFLAWTSHSSDI